MAWFRWGGVCLAAMLTVVACSDDGGASDGEGGSFMDDDIPSTNCQGTSESGACQDSTGGEGGASAGGGSDSCQSSDECTLGDACLAPFDGEVGEFACAPSCLDLMDEAWWCADASACCDPAATCTMRGYCLLPQAGSDGDSGSSEDGSGSSGGSTAGDSSGGETEASSGGSSGSG